MSQPKPEHAVKTPSPRTGLFAMLRAASLRARGRCALRKTRLSHLLNSPFTRALRAHVAKQIKDTGSAAKRAHSLVRERYARPRTLICAATCGALLFASASLATPPSAYAECSNEERRNEQGEPGRALPDCRAYEMVSRPGSETFPSSGNSGERLGYEASIGGDRMAFFTVRTPPPPGSASDGPNFLSTRGPGGWSTADVIPPQTTSAELLCSPQIFYSPDLSQSVLADGGGWGEGYTRHECGHDEPLLVPGEPQGAQNLFLHESGAPAKAGFYQLLNLTPPGLVASNAWFQAGSADFSHIVFNSPLQLTPEAPVPGPGIGIDEDLYEWAGGTLRLVTFLPDGEPVWGLLVNPANTGQTQAGRPQAGQDRGTASFTHALSADGERAFFYAGVHVSEVAIGVNRVYIYAGGSLYMRENAAQEPTASGECSQAEPAKACTLQIDALQGGAGGTGEPHFQWATPDGSRAFFTDQSRLTEDSTAAPGKPDLYEYDLGKPASERLTDLTVNAAEPADVQGLSGISDDGSYVYFVAAGVLSGEQANSEGAKALAGKPNLYLRHAGATTFVATLNAPGEEEQRAYPHGDACDWDSYSNPGGFTVITGGLVRGANCMTAQVSLDGRFLAFNSLRSLTGYDNAVAEPKEPGERDNEIFLYEVATGELHCASCDPSGAPPTAIADGDDPRIPPPAAVSSTGPFGTGGTFVPGYLTRSLSETGQVFFDTTNSLLPADTNDVKDVYEYEGGPLHLISTGASPADATFEDASASGNDVFFNSTQALVRSDTNNSMSLYDARVEGGFLEPPPPPVCETEEACHTAHQEPPPVSTPGSAHFEGPTNGLYCPKGQIKRQGKCVKPRKHHRKGRHHKRANRSRGGAK